MIQIYICFPTGSGISYYFLLPSLINHVFRLKLCTYLYRYFFSSKACTNFLIFFSTSNSASLCSFSLQFFGIAVICVQIGFYITFTFTFSMTILIYSSSTSWLEFFIENIFLPRSFSTSSLTVFFLQFFGWVTNMHITLSVFSP